MLLKAVHYYENTISLLLYICDTIIMIAIAGVMGDRTVCLWTVCLTDSLPNDNMPTGHLAYRTQCLRTFCIFDIILSEEAK